MSNFEQPRMETEEQSKQRGWQEALGYVGAADVQLVLQDSHEARVEEPLALMTDEGERGAAYSETIAARRAAQRNLAQRNRSLNYRWALQHYGGEARA